MDSNLPCEHDRIGDPAAAAACPHRVHFYSDTSRFLDNLETYIADGLLAGEATIVIATAMHLHALEARLQARGLDLVAARHENRYLPMGAEDALAQFLVDGWPSAERFHALLAQLLLRARGTGRPVRAFGEMVVVLWGNGQRDAAVKLEQLWAQVCAGGQLSLLCAYPLHGFGADDADALACVRSWHTEEVPA
jgi:hypothetical protein